MAILRFKMAPGGAEAGSGVHGGEAGPSLGEKSRVRRAAPSVSHRLLALGPALILSAPRVLSNTPDTETHMQQGCALLHGRGCSQRRSGPSPTASPTGDGPQQASRPPAVRPAGRSLGKHCPQDLLLRKPWTASSIHLRGGTEYRAVTGEPPSPGNKQ